MGIRCLSLFANVGIAEAMFSEIGVNVLIANELIEERARFYREVYPKTNMICGKGGSHPLERTNNWAIKYIRKKFPISNLETFLNVFIFYIAFSINSFSS